MSTQGNGAVLDRFRGDGWEMEVYTRPFGKQLICEVADIAFAKGTRIPYQVHAHGHITALLLAGRAEVTLYGKRCTVEAGDLVQAEPFLPFGFHFLESGVLRVICHGVDAARICRERQQITEQGGAQREALLAELNRREGIRLLPEPTAAAVEKGELPEISPRGTAQETFPLHGVTCRLRAGRWQLGGEAELWAYDLEPGKRLSSAPLPMLPTLALVEAGSVQVDAHGTQRTAKAGEILWFQPCEAFSLTACEDGATLLDGYCGATLLRYLEEWEAAQAAPGGAQQPEIADRNLMQLQGLA